MNVSENAPVGTESSINESLKTILATILVILFWNQANDFRFAPSVSDMDVETVYNIRCCRCK